MNDLEKLILAARKAVMAMISEDAQWQGEGYQGGYSADQIKELQQALKPYEYLLPGQPFLWDSERQ